MAVISRCAVVLGLIVAGCQGVGGSDPVKGRWASTDGVFVATFDSGAFTSRLTGTGETVVADGRYARTGAGYRLSWTSIAANEQRSADCTFTGGRELACTPSVGQPFTMRRVS